MNNQEDVISLLSRLVAIDSQSFKGNKEIITFLQDYFKGYETSTQEWIREMDDVKGKNLIVKVAGESSDHSLIFLCHTDTVPAGNTWETDPFILEEQEGNLYGLGAVDTKGGLAALMQAVTSLKTKPPYDTYLVFDGDEEVQFTGARKYKKSLNVKNPHIIAVEPTDKNVCIGARSIINMEIITHGKAQHASFGSPEVNKAQSAVYKMYKIMTVLIADAQKLGREKDKVMGSNSQNLGLIQGGTADNVIPDKCSMALDRRLLPKRDLVKNVDSMKKLIRQADPQAAIRVQLTEKGFQTSADAPLVRHALTIMRQTYQNAQLTRFTAMSEAAIFQNKADSIVWGPGSIAVAHKAQEYISAQEVMQFVHLYKSFIENVAF